MTSPFDPELSAVERMLTDRARQSPPPTLRPRVLAAVDDVLPKKVPATKFGQAAQRHPPEYAELVAGTWLMGTALSLLLVAMLSREATSRRVVAATDRPLLSFSQRAEAAGITLDVIPPSTDRLASVQPIDTSSPRHGHILHSLDTRFFLQGDL